MKKIYWPGLKISDSNYETGWMIENFLSPLKPQTNAGLSNLASASVLSGATNSNPVFKLKQVLLNLQVRHNPLAHGSVFVSA
jgi:hypothetical protein